MNCEFVLPDMDMPISYDPLEADYTNNLHASQMIHRSLLDIESENSLTSGVLSHFSYEPQTMTIRLTTDKRAKFSDGSSIESGDIAMTIRRMAARRPTFPVLRHIRGVEAWSRLSCPLTRPFEGIEIQGETVQVHLSANLKNPLFRFAFPLFGVVKAACVDLLTNKLKDECPTSGFYHLAGAQESVLKFALNDQYRGQAPYRQLPAAIRLRYLKKPLSATDLERMKTGSYIVFVEEHGAKPRWVHEQKAFGFDRFEQPNSRFSAFLLNPRNEVFSRTDRRMVFASAIREALKSSMPNRQLESSVFSQSMPGYLTNEELESSMKISDEQVRSCKESLKGKTIRWMPMNVHGNNAALESALRQAVDRFAMQLEVLPEVSRKERFDDFVCNRLDVTMISTGFWPLDPVGDIQMLFTKDLHKPLQFVTGDEKLQSLLTGLEFEKDSTQRLLRINRYLYNEALFNVFARSKRVYLRKGNGFKSDIPIAITPPAPWQLFHVDDH